MTEREQERADVVRWLREEAAQFSPTERTAETLLDAADDIERGEHLGGV